MSNANHVATAPDLLSYANGTLTEPFGLRLDDGSLLQVEAVVRRVPAKRVVGRGVLNGKPVYAKCFIGPRAAQYAARDKRGATWLAEAGLATPALLLESAIVQQGASVLVYEAISASNAEQVWQATPEDQRLPLAMRLVEAVAAHHRAGLLQTDLYLKNFLVDGDAIHTLDGDGIRRLSGLGRRGKRLNNLAVLLSKLDVAPIGAWVPALLQQYASVMNEPPPEFSEMQRRITRFWQQEMQDYARKVQRTCTDVRTLSTATGYIAINRLYDSPGLHAALLAPDALLDGPGISRLKSGNTCTVAATEIDQRKLVIKRYNIKSFWHGLGRAWRPSRAVVSWANAFRLQLKGIATPVAVAVMERRRWGFRQEAYLLTEFVDARDAVEFFADHGMPDTVRSLVAQRIAQLFYQLYCLQLEHGDFKATNLLIQDQKPLLIDLDSMQQHACKRSFLRRHVRDVKRFFRNWRSDLVTRQLLMSAFKTVYTDTRVLQRAGIAN